MANTKLLDSWDREMANCGADFRPLYTSMLAMSRDEAAPETATADFWWRLSKVTKLMCDEIDFERNETEYRLSTAESLRYAKRALQLEPDCFDAHLYAAQAAGKLALFEDDKSPQRLGLIDQFWTHLTACKRERPAHPFVIFLEARFGAALLFNVNTDEEREALKRRPDFAYLFPVDTDAIERKLRHCAREMPDSIDVMTVLAFTLHFIGKADEARAVARRALETITRRTRSDHLMARQLNQLVISSPTQTTTNSTATASTSTANNGTNTDVAKT